MLPNEKKLDPRIVRTRRDLASSMCTLMREKPLAQITVQEITDKAIINRATFYAHFEDKYQLLEYMVRGSFQAKLEQKITSCDGFTPTHLRLLMEVTCEFLEEFDAKYALPYTVGHPPVAQQIQPFLYDVLFYWAKTSEIESPETIAVLASWAMFGTALEWSRSKRDVPMQTLIDQSMHLLLHGVVQQVEISN